MHFVRRISRVKWLLVGLYLFAGEAVTAQKYYLVKSGDMSIHFEYQGGIYNANSDTVDIIFNREKMVLWITIRGTDFKTGKKKIDKRLFRKNENEFVIKADLTFDDIVHSNKEFLQFSMVGYVFNKVEREPLSLMGRLGDVDDGKKGELSLNMFFGFGSKWMGTRFMKYTNYPVLNIHIYAIMEPFDESTMEAKGDNH